MIRLRKPMPAILRQRNLFSLQYIEGILFFKIILKIKAPKRNVSLRENVNWVTFLESPQLLVKMLVSISAKELRVAFGSPMIHQSWCVSHSWTAMVAFHQQLSALIVCQENKVANPKSKYAGAEEHVLVNFCHGYVQI